MKKSPKNLVLIIFMLLLPLKSTTFSAQEENNLSQKKYYAAIRLIGEKKYREAIDKFKEIIHQDPSYSRAYGKIVFVSKRLDEFDSAAEYFKGILKKDESNGYAYNSLALLERFRGNYEAARTNILKAIEFAPDYEFCYKNLVDIYKKLNQLNQAENILNEKLKTIPQNAALYFGLAYLYQNKRQWQKAHEYYEKTIALNREIYSAYEQKGILYYYAGKNKDFLKYSLMGLELARKNNDPEKEAKFLGNAAAAALNLAQYADALNYFEQALQLNKEFGNQESVEKIYVNIGVIYHDTEKYERALSYFNKALKMSKVLNDKNVEALCYRHKGSVYLSMRQFSKATENFNRAEALVNQIENISVKKVFFWSMGASFYEMADFSRALKYSQKAYQLAVELGDQFGQQRNANIMGLACWNLGQYSRALDYFEKTLKIAQKMGDKEGQSYGLGNMGIIFDLLGDYGRSLSYSNQALKIARSARNKKEEGRLLGNIGIIYQKQNNFEMAKRYYDQAIEIAQEIGNRSDEAEFLGNLGLLFSKIGDYEKAETYFRKALQIATGINNKKLLGNELINIGELAYLKNDLSGAEDYYKKALQIGVKSGNSEQIWESSAGLGSVYEARGELQRAFRYYSKAIAQIDKVRSELQIAEFKAGFLADKTTVFEKAINLLAKLHQKNPQKGYADKAFYYSEKARARAFLDLLAEAKAKVETGVSESLKIKERELLRKISDVQTKLQNPSLGAEEWKILLAKLEQLEQKFSDLKREIRKNNPRYANLIYPQPYSLKQIKKKILGQESALIEFSLGDINSFLWIVTREKTNLFRLPGRAEIENDVRKYLSTISKPVSLTNSFDRHKMLGIKLYQKLLGKFSHAFRGKTFLYVVPDGILHFLPLETLLSQEGSEKNKSEYLLTKFTFCYAPSASALCFLKENRQKHVKRRKTLLAFGDPNFSGSSALMAVRGESAPLDTTLGERDSIFSGGNLLSRGLYEQRGFKFRRLPFSGFEISEISSLFPPDETQIFFGEAAKEEVVKSLDLSNFKYIHFATHGMIDQERPFRSAIVLTLDNDPAEDGFLQMNEILNLNLYADLVTLSACQTGLGKLQKGEGIVGLTRAFMYSGAPSVVVSLWNINDRSTAQFMKDFYTFLHDRKLPATALRLAKINMLHSSRKLYRHPYFWAPFIIFGDSR